MRLRITLDDKFSWLKNYTPSARRKLIEYALEKLSPEEIQQLLSLPVLPSSSGGQKNEEIDPKIDSKIDMSTFEI